VVVRPRRISDIKPLLTNLAQTSHYEVSFGTLPAELKSYLSTKGIDSRFIAESSGLLCYNASLPTTSFGSNIISGNYMGIQEKFAHTRIYSEISLDFYVDKNYKMLTFLESWMEFIASGSFNNIGLTGENPEINQNNDAYFVRMQYPAYYKANSVKIVKFDRDYSREIEYNFRGLFPINISSLPVSYINSDVLKVSASFQYDRYIAGKTNSFNQVIANDSNNRDPKQSTATFESVQSADELLNKTKESFSFANETGSKLSSSQSTSQQSNTDNAQLREEPLW
jgi:hypothetical protein